MTIRRFQVLLAIGSMLLFVGQAPRPRGTSLNIDQIMEGPDFAGTQPSDVRWSVDGHKVYFRWKTPAEKKDGLYVVDAKGGTPRRLSDAAEKEAPPFGGADNVERTKKVFVQDGDIF